MGSVIRSDQVDLDQVMAKRNDTFGVHHANKAEARKEIEVPKISECTLRLHHPFARAYAETTSRRQFLVESSRRVIAAVHFAIICEWLEQTVIQFLVRYWPQRMIEGREL